MGKLLSFPNHQEKYSGRMLADIISTVNSVTMNCLPARGLKDRCVMDVPIVGDPTGVLGVECNAPMYFRCVHCGPLCVNCMEEFGCSGPTGKHEEDVLEDGA